jgi:DNA-binding transcriptional ArsR family regulator
VQFGPNALDEWAAVYPTLSEGRPGLLGAVTARAEAQTIRLAMLYALLDSSPTIRLDHLRAALAAWQYCEDSARFIFGDTLGDPTADEILRLLRGAERGLARTDIAEHFKRHKSSTEIGRALAVLRSLGLVRSERHGTSGRTAEVWFPGVRPDTDAANSYCEKSERSEKRVTLGVNSLLAHGTNDFRTATTRMAGPEGAPEVCQRVRSDASGGRDQCVSP